MPLDRPAAALCDPVTLEIIRGAIMATQREMEALIERTAISAFIREKKDFYTALFDGNGTMAVGSMVPIFGDLTTPDATSIYQEGIIVPPTKLIDAGVTNEAALAIFHRNSRYPEQSIGDMSALMASVNLGVERMAEVVARHGTETFADALAQLLERTKGLVRRRLAETFDYGTYRFADTIDSDGHGNGPFALRFAITREKGADGEDRFIFDATESDDQAPGPVNLIMNEAVPGMALGLYYLGGDPAQVCNAGGPLSFDEVRLR